MTESTLPVGHEFFQKDVLTGVDASNRAAVKLKLIKCQDLWCECQKSSKAALGFRYE